MWQSGSESGAGTPECFAGACVVVVCLTHASIAQAKGPSPSKALPGFFFWCRPSERVSKWPEVGRTQDRRRSGVQFPYVFGAGLVPAAWG